MKIEWIDVRRSGEVVGAFADRILIKSGPYDTNLRGEKEWCVYERTGIEHDQIGGAFASVDLAKQWAESRCPNG